MRPRPHQLIVIAGTVIGLAVGMVLFDTDPAVLGWVFGLGMGLLGGAFVAAITSGEAIAGDGGGRRSRHSAAPWLEERRDEPGDDR